MTGFIVMNAPENPFSFGVLPTAGSPNRAAAGDDAAFFKLLRRDPSTIGRPLSLKRIRAWRRVIDPKDKWRPNPTLKGLAAAGNRNALFALLNQNPATLSEEFVLAQVRRWRLIIRAYHQAWEFRPSPPNAASTRQTSCPEMEVSARPARKAKSVVFGADAIEREGAKEALRRLGRALIPKRRGRPRLKEVRSDAAKAKTARCSLAKIGAALDPTRPGEKLYYERLTLYTVYEGLREVCRRIRATVRRRQAGRELSTTIRRDLAAKFRLSTEQIERILNTPPRDYALEYLAESLHQDPTRTWPIRATKYPVKEVLARHLSTPIDTLLTPRQLVRIIRHTVALPQEKK